MIRQDRLFLVLFLMYILPTLPLEGTTLVYNLRIRRAFAAGGDVSEQALFGSKHPFHWTATAVPITYRRTRDIVTTAPALHLHEKSTINGAIFNIRYKPNKRWWIEGTTGLETEKASFCGTTNFCAQRTGLDDFVITTGINFFPTQSIQGALFGLAGFPTKTTVTALEAHNTLVGTRFYSLGIGGEASCAFKHTLRESLVAVFQARFIHFFNRTWAPILPETAQIQPGNVTDLLFTAQYRHKKNIFECGYNPTFFTNQAVILPTQTIKTPTFVRNSIYFSYNHIIPSFPLWHTPVLIGAGINFGRSNRFNTKIRFGWISLTAIF